MAKYVKEIKRSKRDVGSIGQMVGHERAAEIELKRDVNLRPVLTCDASISLNLSISSSEGEPRHKRKLSSHAYACAFNYAYVQCGHP